MSTRSRSGRIDRSERQDLETSSTATRTSHQRARFASDPVGTIEQLEEYDTSNPEMPVTPTQPPVADPETPLPESQEDGDEAKVDNPIRVRETDDEYNDRRERGLDDRERSLLARERELHRKLAEANAQRLADLGVEVTPEPSNNIDDLKALTIAMAKKLTSPETEVIATKGPDARAPDKFDGSNRSKLRPFLNQLAIVFQNHEKRFNTDKAKVLYAGSYLSGTAADWFEPILDDTRPDYHLLSTNWQLFKERLQSTFGDANAEATAEHELNNVKMNDKDEVSTYITNFRTYASRVKWDEQSLMYHFKIGLPERILDDLKLVRPKPNTLAELQELTLDLDNAHWEAEREKKLRRQRQGSAHVQLAGPKSSSSTSESRSSNPASGDKKFSKNRDKRQHKSNYPASSNTSHPKSSSVKPNLDKVLDSRGRLTEQEKARRAEKGLCSYCGGAHKLEHCPKKPAVGRMAVASPTTKSEN